MFVDEVIGINSVKSEDTGSSQSGGANLTIPRFGGRKVQPLPWSDTIYKPPIPKTSRTPPWQQGVYKPPAAISKKVPSWQQNLYSPNSSGLVEVPTGHQVFLIESRLTKEISGEDAEIVTKADINEIDLGDFRITRETSLPGGFKHYQVKKTSRSKSQSVESLGKNVDAYYKSNFTELKSLRGITIARNRQNPESAYQTSTFFDDGFENISVFDIQGAYRNGANINASDVMVADIVKAAKLKGLQNVGSIPVPGTIKHSGVSNKPTHEILLPFYKDELNFDSSNNIIRTIDSSHLLFKKLIDAKGSNGILTKRIIDTMNKYNPNKARIESIEVNFYQALNGETVFDLYFKVKKNS